MTNQRVYRLGWPIDQSRLFQTIRVWWTRSYWQIRRHFSQWEVCKTWRSWSCFSQWEGSWTWISQVGMCSWPIRICFGQWEELLTKFSIGSSNILVLILNLVLDYGIFGRMFGQSSPAKAGRRLMPTDLLNLMTLLCLSCPWFNS